MINILVEDINEALNNLEGEPKVELIKLLTHKMLLNTHAREWLENPNEFINMSIPKDVYEFLGSFSNGDEKALGLLITDLVLKGIQSIAINSPDLDGDIVSMVKPEIIEGVTTQ